VPESRVFGVELRRRRVRAGLSLMELAGIVHYSKSYLSRIESGGRRPSVKLARLADAALNANGTLAELVAESDQGRPAPEEPVLSTSAALHREVLAFGDALSLPFALSPSDTRTMVDDDHVEMYFRDRFDRCRHLGQRMPPAFVLRSLVMELCTLLELAQAALRTPAGLRLPLLAARYAEYAGWMAQEAGQRGAALEWTRRAAGIAAEAGATELVAYALVRKAELAMYGQDAVRTVELAERALLHPAANARIRGLASHRQAQGFALMGEYDRCLTALDRAEELLSEPHAEGSGTPGDPGGPALGSLTMGCLDHAVAGWCYYDLGYPRKAAELLERALARTPSTAHRARALYGARLALAYEAAGEIDLVLTVTLQVLADGGPVGSASTHGELRKLSRALIRWHANRPAQELQNQVNDALQRAGSPARQLAELPSKWH
jgi:transcriptional regulator with XRE-family HTH domain